MLTIECPFCGPRDEPEFSYGGESHISRPGPDCSDEEWGRYLFIRANPRGEHAERWCHTHGCGQWFNVLRDTVSHDISAVYRLDEPRPVVGGSSR